MEKKTYVNHVGSDVADTTSPSLRGLVKDVVNADPGVFLGKSIKILLKKDILGSDIGEDEVDLGAVTRSTAADDGANDLEHRSDTSTAGNHTKVTNHVGSVVECALGATNADSLANNQGGHVLGNVAGGVRLDHDFEVARLVVTSNRGVGTNNLLARAIGLGNVGANRDVLSDRKTEDGGLGRELESVARRDKKGHWSVSIDKTDSPGETSGQVGGKPTHIATLWETTVFS